jgi:hypothetical protein
MRSPLFAIDETRSWVVFQGSRLLRLPPSIRTDVYCYTQDAIVLGSGSGRITILRVDSETTGSENRSMS